MKTKLVIFGITGDLSRRKLLPALRKIVASGAAKELQIIGISRQEVDIRALAGAELAKMTKLVTMDLAERAAYTALKRRISPRKGEQTLIYLSVPPTAATRIANYLGEAGINGKSVRLLFEKPFGLDLESAKEMVERTSNYFSEAQMYRIDHYLAKEMAQNIVAFRGGNALFGHIWNNNFVERIEVVAHETIGIEGRGQFYEQTGALRDLVQGGIQPASSTLATAIGVGDKDIKEIKAKGGDLIGFLMDRMKGFAEASTLYAQTFTGKVSGMQEAFNILAAVDGQRFDPGCLP